MTQFQILKKRKDFLRAAKNITVIFHNVLMQAAPNLSAENEQPRIGFTATKRLGKAHIRNRTKRRLRAVVREVYAKHTLPSVDYVLVGRYDTAICPFNDLRTDVIRAFKKINKQIKQENISNEENTDCSD